jgi:hypothetical protein
VVERILCLDEKNLAKYLEYSIRMIADYLKIKTKIINSSEIKCIESGRNKIIPIVHKLKGDTYINMIGGREMYKEDIFTDAKIKLEFMEAHQMPYTNSLHGFIPNLSILDVLFNIKPEDMASRLNFIK